VIVIRSGEPPARDPRGRPIASNDPVEFWTELKAYKEETQMPYVSTAERIGRQKGRQKGRQEGRQEEAGDFWGSFSAAVSDTFRLGRGAIGCSGASRLGGVAERVLDAKTLEAVFSDS